MSEYRYLHSPWGCGVPPPPPRTLPRCLPPSSPAAKELSSEVKAPFGGLVCFSATAPPVAAVLVSVVHLARWGPVVSPLNVFIFQGPSHSPPKNVMEALPWHLRKG